MEINEEAINQLVLEKGGRAYSFIGIGRGCVFHGCQTVGEISQLVLVDHLKSVPE